MIEENSSLEVTPAEEPRDLIAEMQGTTHPTQTEEEWEMGPACSVVDPDCEACQ